MRKSIFFGIWEFIFMIIILLIIAFFVWPAINNSFELKRERAFFEKNNNIVKRFMEYVDDNQSKYSKENTIYKVTLKEMSDLNLVKLPIKNIITSKKYSEEDTYILFEKKDGRYNYELKVLDSYKNSVYLKDMNVKIGDYIEYPISYENVKIDGLDMFEKTGWRIIEVNENEIKIISTSIVKIVDTSYDFFNIDNYKNKKIFGEFYDLDYVYDKVAYLTNKQISKIAVSSNLRTIGKPYYVFNSLNKNPMIVGYDGLLNNTEINSTGIRVVLILRRDVKTTGKIFDKWQLIVKED